MGGKVRVTPDSGAVAETMFTQNSKNTAKSARYEIKKRKKKKANVTTSKTAGYNLLLWNKSPGNTSILRKRKIIITFRKNSTMQTILLGKVFLNMLKELFSQKIYFL